LNKGPISHNAAWQSDELLDCPDWQIQLTQVQLDELEQATRNTADEPIESITPERFRLPTLGPVLKQVQHDLEHGCGATMLRGLDAEHLAGFDDQFARRLFLGLASHIGTPISQSAAGEHVFSVRDAGYATDDKRARGPNTAKRLSFHTDRCDVIGFLCMQQARSGGENLLVSSMALFNRFLDQRPDLLEALTQPYLYKRHNVDTGNELAYCRQPIFSFCEGHFACSFLRVLIERAYADEQTLDMTDLQRQALDALEEFAEDPAMHVRFYQEPGDILFLNNWVTLHRRTAFEDHDDPARRRHILRIWLSVPNSRPIDPLFADNFGNTEAGAIRGGMRAQ